MYTIDELLRYVDFSFPHGDEVRHYLESLKPTEDVEDDLDLAYDQGVCDTKKYVKSELSATLQDSQTEDLRQTIQDFLDEL